MAKWRKKIKEIKQKSSRKGKEEVDTEEKDYIKEVISEEPLEEEFDEDLDEDVDDEIEEKDNYLKDDDEEHLENEEEEEYEEESMDGSYVDDEDTESFSREDYEEEEIDEEEEEEYKDEVFITPVKKTVQKPKQIKPKKVIKEEPVIEEEEEYEEVDSISSVKKEGIKPNKPKKVDKNLDTETNTFIEIPEKYLLRLTPRARAIVTHFSYLIKKNRRNDKNKKKSINDISKFSSLNEFFNTCIVAYAQSLIFDQQATLRKDDIVSVDDKLITLMNLMTINTLKVNFLIRTQKAQIEAEFANDFKETGGVMPITKEDFKELEAITQITKSLEINQNRWREEQSKESAEKDLRDLEETIRVVEIPIMEDKVDKQKKELIAARKEITRLKKQLGEK